MIPVAWASGHEAEAIAFVVKLNQNIVYPLITLLLALAVLLFVWGSFQYLLNAEDASARQQGKQHILYGLIGIVVMVSAFTILQIAVATFFPTVTITK